METVQRPSMINLATEKVDIEGRAATLKATYGLLAVSVLFAVLGGYVGVRSEMVVNFFSTFIGWIVAIVLLNVIPIVTIRCIGSPALGLLALVADGFVSGIVISPLLWLAGQVSPALIVGAGGFTLLIFTSVTFYVLTRKKEFSAPAAMATGIFVCTVAALGLNYFLNIGFLGVLLSIAVAAFGVFILVVNTSKVLRNPVATGAVPGALLLFAGLFNVFVGVLNLLLRILAIMNGRRR